MTLFIIIGICILLYIFLIFPRMNCRNRVFEAGTTMFAHRGYHDIAHGVPENSMAAFRAALDHDYGIELDLHLTRDGQLVVFHDDTLDRMCQKPDIVESLTYKELSTLPLLNTDQRIPLFHDVLDEINGRVPLLIELKIPFHSLKICEKTYEALMNYHGFFMIQSFNTLGLLWFRMHAPQILRGQLASHLTAENGKEPWILKFFVQNLLCNAVGRPDFISYKLKDLPHLSVLLLKHVLRVPIAVWTLRNEKSLKAGKKHYDFQIFEKHCRNY